MERLSVDIPRIDPKVEDATMQRSAAMVKAAAGCIDDHSDLVEIDGRTWRVTRGYTSPKEAYEELLPGLDMELSKQDDEPLRGIRLYEEVTKQPNALYQRTVGRKRPKTTAARTYVIAQNGMPYAPLKVIHDPIGVERDGAYDHQLAVKEDNPDNILTYTNMLNDIKSGSAPITRSIELKAAQKKKRAKVLGLAATLILGAGTAAYATRESIADRWPSIGRIYNDDAKAEYQIQQEQKALDEQTAKDNEDRIRRDTETRENSSQIAIVESFDQNHPDLSNPSIISQPGEQVFINSTDQFDLTTAPEYVNPDETADVVAELVNDPFAVRSLQYADQLDSSYSKGWDLPEEYDPETHDIHMVHDGGESLIMAAMVHPHTERDGHYIVIQMASVTSTRDLLGDSEIKEALTKEPDQILFQLVSKSLAEQPVND